MDKELEELKKKGNSKLGQVFKIAKASRGKEKDGMKAHAIRDPTNKKLIVNPEEIKEVSVKYCKEGLAKNKPTEGFEEIAKL